MFATAKGKPGGSDWPDGVSGNIYWWYVDSSGEWESRPWTVDYVMTATLSPATWTTQQMVLKDSIYATASGLFKLHMPEGYLDNTEFVLRIWLDVEIETGTYFNWMYNGPLVYEKSMRLSSQSAKYVIVQTDAYYATGDLPTAAVMFNDAAESCCLSRMYWQIEQGNSHTFKAALTADNSVVYGEVEYDKTFEQTMLGFEGPITNYGSSMIGHKYVYKITTPDLLTDTPDYLQFANFMSSSSKEFGIKPTYGNEVFDEDFAKDQYMAGNKNGISAWIPRSDWVNSYDWPRPLRGMSKSEMTSETWTIGTKLAATSSVFEIGFKVQQSWSNWNGFSMTWEALLEYDPGPAYAGILVWVPLYVVDDLGATLYDPFNIMHVYLCTESPH